jgi:predicted esterase
MTATVATHVHRYIAPPPGPRSGWTLLLLHGTGGNEDTLLALGAALAPGAGLLSPRGNVLERGKPRFFRRFAEGVFDQEDLTMRTAELADFITAAAGTYRFDPAQVVAVGLSNGANIATSLLLRRPGQLRAAVLFRPQVPFEPADLPSLRGTPILISAGRDDAMVPAADTERLVDLLEAAGAEVTLDWWPTGHGLAPGEPESAGRWLHRLIETNPSA